MNRFRVLIADDNDTVRRCFASLICESGDIEVIGEASNGSIAVKMAKQLLPDAVIMDVNMPYMDGIEASRAIHAEFPRIQVIGLSMFDKSDMGEKMLKAGAVAYFSKTDPLDKIIAGIHEVLATEASPGLPA
jgi:DNA-binding NarL/FixJ family response regulator